MEEEATIHCTASVKGGHGTIAIDGDSPHQTVEGTYPWCEGGGLCFTLYPDPGYEAEEFKWTRQGDVSWWPITHDRLYVSGAFDSTVEVEFKNISRNRTNGVTTDNDPIGRWRTAFR